ncbi:MAG TPA: hypothetical protein VMU00_01535 [Steroidobacteraceae bacterium]|nr:hypothetical protein [Steroidobacteraceae bacterium]
MYLATLEPAPRRQELKQAYLILIRFHVVLLALVLWALAAHSPPGGQPAPAPAAAPPLAQSAQR